VYACAHAGVFHEVSDKVMLYPAYPVVHPEPWPLVMHYGITYNIEDYAFDKHWHRSLDATTCPGKLFEKPMRKEDLRDPPNSKERRRKEVALECAPLLSFLPRAPTNAMTNPGPPGQKAHRLRGEAAYGDEKVANRDTWFGTARQKRVLERWTNPQPLQPIWGRAAILLCAEGFWICPSFNSHSLSRSAKP
jgi:hypothetical protein